MRRALVCLVCLISFSGQWILAQNQKYRSVFRDINAFNRSETSATDAPYFKAHLKSGGLCIFTDTLWEYNQETDILRGNARLYDTRRKLIWMGVAELKTDTVVLFESNRRLEMQHRQNRLNTRNILTVVDGTIGVLCITIPKACWGSCPTFYTGEGDYVFSADAEGFSEAILPSMEYADIDALYNFHPEEKEFSIKMKNEALETHVVRDVSILAVGHDPSLRTFLGNDDKFYLTDPVFMKHPVVALAEEGDITHKLSAADLDERFSPADRKNMKSKEEIILKFKRGNLEDAGLILNFRQSLMTTYLIYSAMGYMGNTMTDVMSELEENNQILRKHRLIDDELGGIDVYLLEGGIYRHCGVFNETGPIASNQQLMHLGNLPLDDEVTLKLVMNRGLWRLDFAAILPVAGITEPTVIKPGRLLYKGKDNQEDLELLTNPDQHLVSMPGDEFSLYFSMPDDADAGNYDLYLYSKGYYLEWMRESWLKDKNLLKINRLLEDPDRFFRKEAKKYSRYESEIEKIFWSSRINTENYHTHE